MNRNDLSFHGRVAVVTGGTRGIGKSFVDILCRLGCKVIYTGTVPGRSGVKRSGKVYLPLDLSDEASLEQFTAFIRRYGRIDVLINNAGINKIESVHKLDMADWERIIRVNLTGAARVLRDVSAVMVKRRRGGKILNISSIFGVVSKAKRNAYSASKSGLIGLTRSSALDLAPHKILVNALCPGFTDTDMTRRILSAQERKALCRQIPMGRFATEEEIAWAGIWLCSGLNTYMTGQTMVVDGGFIAQ